MCAEVITLLSLLFGSVRFAPARFSSVRFDGLANFRLSFARLFSRSLARSFVRSVARSFSRLELFRGLLVRRFIATVTTDGKAPAKSNNCAG